MSASTVHDLLRCSEPPLEPPTALVLATEQQAGLVAVARRVQAGVPVVIVPVLEWSDQIFFGERIHELGAGDLVLRGPCARTTPDAGASAGAGRRRFRRRRFLAGQVVDAGLETEFIGRIPVRVAVDPLGARDLELVLLQSEGSVLRQYERDFRGYGVDLEVTRDAVAEIAKRASEEKTGARGLVTVLLVWKTAAGNLERRFRRFCEIERPERAKLLDSTVDN